MRAIITGATGYVGSSLCNRLIDEGWEVGVILRPGGRAMREISSQSFTPFIYDGTTDGLTVSMTSFRPDVVFHLASLFIAEHRSDQVTDLINSNVLFGTQLAESTARAGIGHLINTGTSWQHFRTDHYDPVCLYAATKQAFEDVLDFYSDAFGLTVTTLKLFDTYGPRDTRPKVLNLLLSTLRNGEALAMSPGEQELDLVHIDDVTAAFIQCANGHQMELHQAGHNRYGLSSGSTLTLKALAAELERISGKCLNISFGQRPYRSREVMKPWHAAQALPNWAPKIDLATGLSQLLNAAHE